MRDSNRNRLYRAEQSVRASLTPKRGRKAATLGSGDTTFATPDEVSAYIEDALVPACSRWGKAATVPTIEFVDSLPGSTIGRYHHRGERILLAPGEGRTGLVVIHEFVHHLTRGVHGQSHGGEFARAFVDLLTEVRPADGEALRAHYDAQRVIYDPVRQVDAAWKQYVRLRSDCDQEGFDTVELTELVYATKPEDYSGRSNVRVFHPHIEGRPRKGDSLTITRRYGGVDGEVHKVPTSALRYIDAPMVRHR